MDWLSVWVAVALSAIAAGADKRANAEAQATAVVMRRVLREVMALLSIERVVRLSAERSLKDSYLEKGPGDLRRPGQRNYSEASASVSAVSAAGTVSGLSGACEPGLWKPGLCGDGRPGEPKNALPGVRVPSS